MVAIIGDIGSGKSSLVLSMLGEMMAKDNDVEITINDNLAIVN